jgi:hypothetical protein
MKYKDIYSSEDVEELFEELLDLGVDFNELPDEMTLHELVQMSNRLRQ